MRIIKLYNFILKNSKYSLFDKFAYFAFVIVNITALILVIYSTITTWELNRWGWLGLVVILASRGINKNFQNKYIHPFNVSVGGKVYAEKEAEMLDYVQNMGSDLLSSNIKLGAGFIIWTLISSVAIFLTALVLISVNVPLKILLTVLGLEIGISGIIMFKIWQKTHKKVTNSVSQSPVKITSLHWIIGIIVTALFIVAMLVFGPNR